MTNNFLKITFRKILRNKVHSAISILGLALGISSCLFISMYIFDELGYDEYHTKKDRIVRLTNILDFNGSSHTAVTDLPTAPTLKQDYPEIEEFVRFRRAGGPGGSEISYENKIINLSNVWFCDSTVFDVFTYNIVNGDAETALKAPHSIVLTQNTANQYFGNEDPIGKQMKINNSFLTVTAVMKAPPANSEIPINALISLTSLPPQFHQIHNQDWFRIGFMTFLLFKEKPNIEAFEQKMVEFEKKYVQPWAEANQVKAGLKYFLTPLEDVHFENTLEYDLPKGNLNYIYTFSLLAVFILIIASINYINLSLAQSSKRAKEVGVRKTLGAERKELIVNFLAESVVITCIATIIGLAFVELWLGTFNSVTGKELSMGAVFSLNNILVLAGMIGLVGVIASAYPALVLSSFNPSQVLKGVMPAGTSVGFVRKSLIFVQFLFSIFMITGTILVNEQMDFMRSMNLGFDRENVISVSIPRDSTVNRQVPAWVEELRNDNRIASVSLTNMPTGNTGKLMFRVQSEQGMKEQTVRFLFVDEHFIDVLGLEVLKGRNFIRDMATDQRQAFIINEYAAKAYGWGDSALNKRVQWGLLPNGGAQNDGKVIGVVSDFHFLSLHNPMEPMILCYNPQGSNTMSVRFNTGDYTSAIAKMETRWNEMAPNHPFNFTFFEDALERNYRQEQSLGELFNYFAFIAILIASLGLFALVSFTIQNRLKEIGVRKVLGATLAQLSWVLMKDFFYLMIIAFVFTVPVNYFLNNQWLETFAYDAPFNVLNYVVTIVASLLVAMITVSYHIYRVSKFDPVVALRYE